MIYRLKQCMQWLGRMVFSMNSNGIAHQTIVEKYGAYFEPRDASTSRERKVVSIYARGNPSLAKGLFVDDEQFKKKIEFAVQCEFSPIS